MKWKKGQMSLEMIIGLVILLVLAAVVITLFTNVFGGGVQQGEDIVSESEVQRQCQSLCSGWQNAEGQTQTLSAAFTYCTETFEFDSNGDDIISGQAVEQGYNSYCEDETHCFNVPSVSCERGNQLLDAQECVDMMQSYYTQVQGLTDTEANTRISTVAGNSNTCDIATFEGPAGEQGTWVQDWNDVAP